MRNKAITATALVNYLTKNYLNIKVLEKDKDTIVLNVEESAYTKDGLLLFNYWAEDYKEERFVMGVRKTLNEYIEKNGWYTEWVNSYTIAIAKA